MQELPETAPPATPGQSRAPFTPRLELFGEKLLLLDDEGESESVAGVARLSFDYGGLESVPEGTGAHDGAPVDPSPSRDLRLEALAARLVEGFGAVELANVTGCLPEYDTRANYLIALGDQCHVGCSFSAHALPILRRRGFQVIVHPSFPFRTVPADSQPYGSVDTDQKLDWFTVELGVEIDGQAYNLVPALLEVLEQTSEGSSFESLANCPARFRAVPLGDGRYAVMPWERLSLILAVLAELYPSGAQGQRDLTLPLARLTELDRLGRVWALDGAITTWREGEEWVLRAQSLGHGPRWTPQPASLRAELRSYQHEGLMWLEHLRDAAVGGVLADDMGLGKTLQTIALLCREKEARRMDRPSLIIAPTTLVGNWERELAKFAPHIRVFCHTGPRRHQRAGQFDRAEVVITSYPILIRDLMGLCEREYHYAILDEAQAIKNVRSLASTSVRSLTARHRLALSGTPVENSLTELWSLFEFVLPGLLGRQEQFRREFQLPIEKLGDDARLGQLRSRVAPFILRRLKENVLCELPPKTELVRAVQLTGAQRDLYESIRLAADADVRAAIAQKGMGASAITILDALMKLRQVCCDPRIVSVEGARNIKVSAKYELFFELLEVQLGEGRRVLVFSQFTRMLGLLSQGLTSRQIHHLTLTGASTNRQSLVDRFERGETSVFLISLKAGGTGLNLVSADTVIHYDPWWNAAAQMQATDRAHRLGQKKPVFVYNLIALSSVEERMLALQRKKRHLADNILSEEGSVGSLSKTDVEDLFAPLDGDESL